MSLSSERMIHGHKIARLLLRNRGNRVLIAVTLAVLLLLDAAFLIWILDVWLKPFSVPPAWVP